MELQLTLTGPVPKWATKRKRGYIDDPSAKQFGRWARAVATRFTGRVNLWSIWNEPNHPDFLGPQYSDGKPHTPMLYRKLYRPASARSTACRGGATDKVLFGETAPIGNAERRLAARLPARRDVPEPRLQEAQGLREAADRRLRAPRLHAQVAARRSSPRTPTRSASASLGRLTEALDKAARAGAIAPSARST